MSLNIEKLRGKVPDVVFGQINTVITLFEVNTSLRMSHFMSQCAHESGFFKLTEENLNYSAKGLLSVFGKYFDKDDALEYERQPERIASRVYANRMGNGDEESKEGWKYRGRGYIQLTGRHNYETLGKLLNVDLVERPEFVATRYPLLSAAWFWKTNGLNEIADRGDTFEVVTKITKRINGGILGLDDRYSYFEKFNNLLD
jgi:putative chitinase